MNQVDAARLLAVASGYDGRKPNPDAVSAWTIALANFDARDCVEAINAHYQESREWIMPVDIIRRVRQMMSLGRGTDAGQRAIAGNPEDKQWVIDNHCGFSGCPCTHTGTCVKGWIDAPILTYDRTRPCPVCRPVLDGLLSQARDAQEQTRLLHAPRQRAR